MGSPMDDIWEECFDGVSAECNALRKRVAELEAGLKPFAEVAYSVGDVKGTHPHPPSPSDNWKVGVVAAGVVSDTCNLAHCRRAAELLAKVTAD